MDRRDALKSLTALAGSVGLSVTPVTAKEVQEVDLIIIKVKEPISHETALHIRDCWTEGVKGTSLEHCKALVMDDRIEVELVKRAK